MADDNSPAPTSDNPGTTTPGDEQPPKPIDGDNASKKLASDLGSEVEALSKEDPAEPSPSETTPSGGNGAVEKPDDAPATDDVTSTNNEEAGETNLEKTDKSTSQVVEATSAVESGSLQENVKSSKQPTEEGAVEVTSGDDKVEKTPRVTIKPPSIVTDAAATYPTNTKEAPSTSPSFSDAFGTKPSKSTSPSMTFGAAFGGDPRPATPTMAVVTPSPVEASTGDTTTTEIGTSSTAFGAKKNKKVLGRVSQYLDKVVKEPLPGDFIESPASGRGSFSPNLSPNQNSSRSLVVSTVDTKSLPKLGSVREKFESSARSTGSGTPVFEFGEAFRQKQRFSTQVVKEKEKEAKLNIRGFDEEVGGSGEVDSAHLQKTFTFEGSNWKPENPDGTCKVDYASTDYYGMVFIVHSTRGMLLLNTKSTSARRQIPGGKVLEDDFLKAAKQSSREKTQLQLGAREAAARYLFNEIGLDVREHLHRLTPAILRMSPPPDATGQSLRNEIKSTLYYFLSVTDEDFETEVDGEFVPLTRPKGDKRGNSPDDTTLSTVYTSFKFVSEPSAAATAMDSLGDTETTTALKMVMTQAAETDTNAMEKGENFDKMVTDSSKPPKGQDQSSPGQEKDKKSQSNQPRPEEAEVCCCCGFW